MIVRVPYGTGSLRGLWITEDFRGSIRIVSDARLVRRRSPLTKTVKREPSAISRCTPGHEKDEERREDSIFKLCVVDTMRKTTRTMDDNGAITPLRGSLSYRGDSCFVTESELKWQDLRATESKRRALLKRAGDSFFNILFSYEGTFWRIMTRDLLLWLTIGVYVIFRIVNKTCGHDFAISANQIGAVGAVMTFFLFFYHAQYSTRFERFFQNSTGVQGRIFDVATTIKAALPFDRGVRIVRHLNGASILGYVGLSGVYSHEEFLVPLNERYKIFTEEEYERILQIKQSGFSSDPVREVITWVVTDINDALRQGFIDPHTAQDLRGQVLRVRGIIADMYDHYEQPLQFIYVHFIVILSVFYLFLLTIYISHEVNTSESAHWFNEVVGFLALLLQCTFVIGIRYVAQVLRIPYAGELESLPVLSYAEECLNMSLRIMYSNGYRAPEASTEQYLCRGRQSLGLFWEPKNDFAEHHTEVLTS
jgi:hypothetical protein